MPFDPSRYEPVTPIPMADRNWPNRVITRAPEWCSVDLRDGNQALVEPMGYDRKLRLFESLVRIGFKQIEVGFPAASQTDFDFVRRLIEEDRIPSDVKIQVLVQAREDLIERTFEAIRGARCVIVHLYNSTSELQRRVVFGKDRAAIRQLAVQGTRWVKERADAQIGTEILFEYSPESFTGTELDFAVEVCDAVVETFGATEQRKIILNLPATVEMATPNVYADQVEWMIRHLARRETCIISVHTHNDRGTAVAATELALMAGADRVEGTLFGNGERTGNVDLVTVGLNLYSQGIAPELDFGDLPEIVRVYEECCRLPVHPRHPYAGELVYTAFSGSHQDAIRKGLAALTQNESRIWQVPYLPIDPADVGRRYEALVRINSQSGKGGVAFVLERTAGYRVPKALAAVFSQSIQRVTDATGAELTAHDVHQRFLDEFVHPAQAWTLEAVDVARGAAESCHVQVKLRSGVCLFDVAGEGNGPIDAFIRGINANRGLDIHCIDYAEHALRGGEDAEAVAYVHLRSPVGDAWGVGQAPDIVVASLRAVLAAMARLTLEPTERPATRDAPRRAAVAASYNASE